MDVLLQFKGNTSSLKVYRMMMHEPNCYFQVPVMVEGDMSRGCVHISSLPNILTCC